MLACESVPWPFKAKKEKKRKREREPLPHRICRSACLTTIVNYCYPMDEDFPVMLS